MIWYLMNAFIDKVKINELRKWKDLSLRVRISLLSLIITGLIFLFSGIFFSKYPSINGVLLLLFIVVFIILYIFVRKDNIKNYIKDLDWYNGKLDIFRDLLKDDNFNLYTKDKIKLLIELYNEELPKLQISKSLFKPLITIFSSMIIPIIVYGFKLFSDSIGINFMVYILAFAIAFILYLLGIYYILRHTMIRLLDSQYYVIKNVIAMMNDIILKDFTT